MRINPFWKHALFRLSLFFSFLLSAPHPAYNQTPTLPLYQVVRVVDGDTVILSDGNIQFTLRIAGLDAPEKKQPYGQEAKKFLNDLIMGHPVKVQPLRRGIDPYGRSLGHLYIGPQDVGVALIQAGLSFYYRPGCVDYPVNKKKYDYDPRIYVEAEIKAHKKRQGMWSRNDVELACAFRREQKKLSSLNQELEAEQRDLSELLDKEF